MLKDAQRRNGALVSILMSLAQHFSHAQHLFHAQQAIYSAEVDGLSTVARCRILACLPTPTVPLTAQYNAMRTKSCAREELTPMDA